MDSVSEQPQKNCKRRKRNRSPQQFRTRGQLQQQVKEETAQQPSLDTARKKTTVRRSPRAAIQRGEWPNKCKNELYEETGLSESDASSQRNGGQNNEYACGSSGVKIGNASSPNRASPEQCAAPYKQPANNRQQRTGTIDKKAERKATSKEEEIRHPNRRTAKCDVSNRTAEWIEQSKQGNGLEEASDETGIRSQNECCRDDWYI